MTNQSVVSWDFVTLLTDDFPLLYLCLRAVVPSPVRAAEVSVAAPEHK